MKQFLKSGPLHHQFTSAPVFSPQKNVVEHQIQFGLTCRSIQSPMIEATLAAAEIAAKAKSLNLPIQLCLSGGIDSEAMAKAFIKAEAEFEVYIWRYNTDWNEFDYEHAIHFCNQNSITPNFIDLDVFDFYDSEEHLEFGKKYGCRSPQIAVHLKMLEIMNSIRPGIPVLAGNPIFPVFNDLKRSLKENTGYLSIQELVGAPGQTHSVYLRYFEQNERIGLPFFFLHTPELVFSFFKTDTFINRISGEHTCYGYNAKCEAYADGDFSVEPRENKYTGFERYRQEFNRGSDDQSICIYNEKFRKPLELMNPALDLEINMTVPKEIIALLKKMHQRPFSKMSTEPTRSQQLSSRRNFFRGAVEAAAAFGLIVFMPFKASAYICIGAGDGSDADACCFAGYKNGGTPTTGKDQCGSCVTSCCMSLTPKTLPPVCQ